MQQRPSREYLQRLDNAAIIKFITSTAACLAQADQLSAHDAEDLRISLSGLQGEEQQRPLIIALNEQNSEFLALLTNRYGALGLSRNIFRYSLRLALSDCSVALSELGDTLLNKSRVLFNQPFFIYFAGKCQKRALFSSVLVELAETIDLTSFTLENASNRLETMIPLNATSRTEADQKLDLETAKSVGFKRIGEDCVGFGREESGKAMIVAAFCSLVAALHSFLEQLRHNQLKDDTSRTTTICEALQAELQLVNAYSFPRTTDLATWDVRRRGFLEALHCLTRHIKELNQEFMQKLTRLSNVQGASAHDLPEDVIRGMSSTLIKQGTTPNKAYAAACALVRYCTEHSITADKILPAELPKIDPNLTPATLSVFQQRGQVPQETSEKEHNLRRFEALMQQFHQRLTKAGVIITILFVFLLGCGVKLAPKSDLIDYRPPVRYHTQRPTPEYIERTQIDTKAKDQKTQEKAESTDGKQQK